MVVRIIFKSINSMTDENFCSSSHDKYVLVHDNDEYIDVVVPVFFVIFFRTLFECYGCIHNSSLVFLHHFDTMRPKLLYVSNIF